MLARNSVPSEAAATRKPVINGQQFAKYDILLKPISHPQLGNICIDEDLFAIGRTEAPFDSYDPVLVGDLSRRHARIFSEYGAVYMADLGSKNGTTVNGINICQKTCRLQDGDEICLGGTLSYRVELRVRTKASEWPIKLRSLTLTPESGEQGLEPIVITQFPFLISKADDTFAHYRDRFPHQVDYLSRRHAHVFLKSGTPYIEDLGSTNGTFVDGVRLDEHAVPLKEGALLAFGGHHFVYTVSLQAEEPENESTVTRMSPAQRGTSGEAAALAPEAAGNVEKTTFVAAADSFLDIFCADQAQKEDEISNEDVKQAGEGPAKQEAGRRRRRSKFAIFFSELREAFGGNGCEGSKHRRWTGVSVAAAMSAVALGIYFYGASGDNLKDLMARSEYARAAMVAHRYLQRHPDDAEVKAIATEALLKENVPKWQDLLKAREFDRAAALLSGMEQNSRYNDEVQPFLNELKWIGSLETFVMSRGGVDAPIQMYSDEEKIATFIREWNEHALARQTAAARIAVIVPEFRDLYADALSHLRKMQSDDAVYLGAINRLKDTIATELERDRPQALESVLKEYAEKFPRIGGLDALSQDLRQYIAIESEIGAQRLGLLMTKLDKAKFVTPPFQEKFRALSASGKLPSPEMVQRYAAVSTAWRAGNSQQAFAELQTLSASPWGSRVAKEMERKKAITDEFAALQKARGSKGFEDRVLAFYGRLNPDEDVYFIRAVENDIGLPRKQAMKRAQELVDQAQSLWEQYQKNGPIESAQRIESSISNRFRAQARLLAEAQKNMEQAMLVTRQLRTDAPAEWRKAHEAIDAEARLQRRALQELRMVLEPAVLKEKLALIGARDDARR